MPELQKRTCTSSAPSSQTSISVLNPFTGNVLWNCLLLDALNISHPANDATSTQLIQAFPFRRGEQWMMAMKARIFEQYGKGDNNFLRELVVDEEDFFATL